MLDINKSETENIGKEWNVYMGYWEFSICKSKGCLNFFIMGSAVVDPESMLGTLGGRWEYTLEESVHIHTLFHT